MISPEMYAEQLQDATYLELIAERDNLIRYIRHYEKSEMRGDRSGKEWSINPQPVVRYQVYLEYLSELCRLMKEKYNKDYVWGERKLQEDVKSFKSKDQRRN